jgi:hypothetical protein
LAPNFFIIFENRFWVSAGTVDTKNNLFFVS